MPDSVCRLQMTMFSIGALQALAACVSPACKWGFPSQQLQLLSAASRWLPQRVALHTLLSNGIAFATVAVWLVFRNWAWGWLLQDLLGVCLIVLVLRQFRLPNLKVSALSLLFACHALRRLESVAELTAKLTQLNRTNDRCQSLKALDKTAPSNSDSILLEVVQIQLLTAGGQHIAAIVFCI